MGSANNGPSAVRNTVDYVKGLAVQLAFDLCQVSL